MRFVICLILSTLALLLTGFSQTRKEEDIIILKWADKGGHIQKDGITLYMAIGNVKFEHNKTIMLCDTATWDRENGIVDAIGSVQIIQGQTKLKGNKIHYIERLNLAQVRGDIVELSDKKNNRLRTQFLDFNTKDSIGTFFSGGSMIDSAGNILESVIGHYYSKEKLFTFERQVEMSTDSVSIKADTIHYRTDTNIATFSGNIHAWHADGYLRASRGRYERNIEFFHFRRNVYVKTDDQEVWADELNFDRKNSTGSLFGNIQILDTTQSVILLGDEGYFQNQPQKVRLSKDPIFITYNVDKNVLDTLFSRADTLLYMMIPRYQADSADVVRSEARLRALSPKLAVVEGAGVKPVPTVDSLQMLPVVDTISVDRVEPVVGAGVKPAPTVDSTLIRFIRAWRNVKVYRSNGQGICDSIIYNSIDSTARLFGDPVLWHENNQFSADSIQFFLPNNQLARADLFSSAFVISQEEDTPLYNQIKGNNMIGYFRDNDIYRFDVIGAAETIFCIREDGPITSLLKGESKQLIIRLKNRQAQRISYIENTKNDLYPLYDMSDQERQLTKFNWRIGDRPKDRFDITSRSIRRTEVDQLGRIPQPTFSYTLLYFPKHPLPKPIEKKKKVTSTEIPELITTESIPVPSDTLAIKPLHIPQTDTLQVAQVLIHHPDTLALPVQERIEIALKPVETQELAQIPALTKKELRAQQKAIRKEQAALRKAEKKRLKAERKKVKVNR